MSLALLVSSTTGNFHRRLGAEEFRGEDLLYEVRALQGLVRGLRRDFERIQLPPAGRVGLKRSKRPLSV